MEGASWRGRGFFSTKSLNLKIRRGRLSDFFFDKESKSKKIGCECFWGIFFDKLTKNPYQIFLEGGRVSVAGVFIAFCFGDDCSFCLLVRVCLKFLSIFVVDIFSFGFEVGMWDSTVLC